uniref:Uncharacterized protein n=1 Tax=Picea sitchensis TaxID=3332 RepID=A9NQK9_PICSI|nr:unknown [Picea sitchensis]
MKCQLQRLILQLVAGPLEVVEHAAEDIHIDAVVARTLNWVQNTQYINNDQLIVQLNSQEGPAALVRPQHHNKHQDSLAD